MLQCFVNRLIYPECCDFFTSQSQLYTRIPSSFVVANNIDSACACACVCVYVCTCVVYVCECVCCVCVLCMCASVSVSACVNYITATA